MEELIEKLKRELIEELNLEEVTPEEINPDEPLFGDGGLGLDSIDALEIILILERNYGIKIKNPAEGKQIFYSIRTLAISLKIRNNEDICNRFRCCFRYWSGCCRKYSFTQETSAWYGESHSFPYGTGCTRIRGKIQQ